MFFKKDIMNYNKSDDFFILNDKKIEFFTINAIYLQATSYSTNSVYEKRDTLITIRLENDTEIVLKADTRDLEEYKNLENLRESITSYRYKQLHRKYLQNDTISFCLKNDEYSLVFRDKKLFVEFNRVKRPRSIDFQVIIIEQNQQILKLKGLDEKEIISFWFISDTELFVKLAESLVEYITAYETMQKKALFNAKIYKYFMMFCIPFGLNGMSEMFFDNSLFPNIESIQNLSLLAGILLWITILTAPFSIFVNKVNFNKHQRENNFTRRNGRK